MYGTGGCGRLGGGTSSWRLWCCLWFLAVGLSGVVHGETTKLPLQPPEQLWQTFRSSSQRARESWKQLETALSRCEQTLSDNEQQWRKLHESLTRDNEQQQQELQRLETLSTSLEQAESHSTDLSQQVKSASDALQRAQSDHWWWGVLGTGAGVAIALLFSALVGR